MEKLNRQNTEHSQEQSDADSLRQDDGGRQESAELILDGSDASAAQPGDSKKVAHQGEEGEEEEDDNGNIFEDSESEEEKQHGKVEDDETRKHRGKAESSNSETSSSVSADVCPASLQPQQRSSQSDSF